MSVFLCKTRTRIADGLGDQPGGLCKLGLTAPFPRSALNRANIGSCT